LLGSLTLAHYLKLLARVIVVVDDTAPRIHKGIGLPLRDINLLFCHIQALQELLVLTCFYIFIDLVLINNMIFLRVIIACLVTPVVRVHLPHMFELLLLLI
jgi:hypothetical protein